MSMKEPVITKKKLKPVPLKIGGGWNPENTIYVS